MTTQHASTRRTSSRTQALAVLLAAGMSSTALAQWAVVNLHPQAATVSEAWAVQNGQQVGFGGLFDDALLWTGSADSVVTLDPDPALQAVAVCVDAGMQGGWAHVVVDGLPKQHAALWSGSSKSFVDLHPVGATNSQITAMHAGTQGGIWFPEGKGGGFTLGHPCLWRGTADSFVDLTPPGVTYGEVHGVFGDVQVGSNNDSFLAQACMWRGTPESYISLQPALAFFSTALCADENHQYGVILTFDGEDFNTAYTDVGYWSGSAESWVSLTPTGRYGAAITGAHGGRQVGVMSEDPIGNGPFTAATWTGTTESFEDLHQYLAPEYTQSWAYGVWHDPDGTAYIVGTAYNSTLERNEAVMWVSGGDTCAADFDNSGEVNSQDFFDFLGAFFAGEPEADFDADGTINSQDFFAFLTAFFNGC